MLHRTSYLIGSPSSSSLYCNLHEDECLSILLPSKLHTAPVRDRVWPFSSDLTATGAEHPPPSLRRKLLSASTWKVVAPWNNGSRSLRVAKSSSLHSIAKAPCPTAYNSSSVSNFCNVACLIIYSLINNYRTSFVNNASERCARKHSQPNLRYYPSIWQKGLRRTTKKHQDTKFPSQYMNLVPLKYKSGMLTTWAWQSFRFEDHMKTENLKSVMKTEYKEDHRSKVQPLSGR